MRQHALPSPIALQKNVCGPFVRAELLSHEFTLRAGCPGNDRAVSINADPKIFGLHHAVRQGARFDNLKKACPINYFSVRANDDPVICTSRPVSLCVFLTLASVYSLSSFDSSLSAVFL